VTALVAVGGTLIGAAVALAAVLLTLDLERRATREQRWAELQTRLLGEALSWVETATSNFGEVLELLNEYRSGLEERRPELLQRATDRAQVFYDHEQNLREVDRLQRLLDSDEVIEALRKADGVLRLWNETVAGDHTTHAVDLLQDEGRSAWGVFGTLAESRDHVLDTYAAAVRLAYEAEGEPPP
jgi:hypothetical protein